MTELIDPSAWEEYGCYGACIITISSGTISFTGSPTPSNSEYTTCGSGAEHPPVDLTCVDEITFDYSSSYGGIGSNSFYFKVDNDTLWTLYNVTESGTATIDVSSYTGSHYLRFFRYSVASPYAYEPWTAGAYMPTTISNISAIATYSPPSITELRANRNSMYVPVDVTWGAIAEGGCPPTGISIDWEIKRDGVVIETITTDAVASFTRTYVTEGTYTTTITAKNSEESSPSLWLTIELFAIAPSADFSADRQIAPVGASVNFSDQSLYNPTSWVWKYRRDGGSWVNFTNYTSQNPSQVFTSEGLYDISLTATSAYGSDTKTKLGYILVDNSVVVGSYPYKGSNEFAILLVRGSSYEHLIHHKGNTASILDMKVTRSDGGTSVAEFTLAATHRMSNETDLLQLDTQVFVLHYDWVSFSGVITEIEWNTKDVYGSSLTIPFRKVKIICEGATSLLKREFIQTDEVIIDTPGQIFKQILVNSGCTDLEGTVQIDEAGTQKRQFGVMKGTTYDAVSNLCDSTGYRMFDEHEGSYFRGQLNDSTTPNHAWLATADGVGDIEVGDYLFYLKRDATATGYSAIDTRNTLARYKIAGRITDVSSMANLFTVDVGCTLSTEYGDDWDYIKHAVVAVIKSDGARVGFSVDRETNIEPLLDIGKMVLDSDLIDTDYVNATVFTCTTVNQGRKVSATVPACVKIDDAGTGDYFTFVSPYPCGSYVVDHYGNSIHIQGHNLYDTSDAPDILYFVYKDPSGTGDLDYVRVDLDLSTADIKEYYDNGIPITVITNSSFGAISTIPRGAFVVMKYDSDGNQTVPWYRRLYVSTTTGFSVNDKIIVGTGFPSYSDRTFNVLSVGTGYIYVYSYADYSVSFEDRPFFTGAIVFKETPSGTTYTKDDPETGSPIDQRGVITRTITCAQGSTIPELEVIASSYAVSEGVFADIGEGKVPSRYAYSSIYPIPAEINYTINKPLIESSLVKVRFNDETRSYRVAKATYDYMRYMATFEFGGKKRDIPDSIKSVMSVTNTTG